MALTVKFTFRDSYKRPRSRTFVTTSNTIADALTDVSALAALWNPLTDLALESVMISQDSIASAFAGVAGSNVDENLSAKVVGGDGFNYDFNLPDMPAAKLNSDGTLITGDADVAAFFCCFCRWRGVAD